MTSSFSNFNSTSINCFWFINIYHVKAQFDTLMGEVYCLQNTFYLYYVQMRTGWIEVKREVIIKYELENTPLQIKTNSEEGSNETAYVTFYNTNQLAGGVSFNLTAPQRYKLRKCSKYTNFPTGLPSETNKVWTITLSRTRGERRVVIHCNNKEVLNVVMSNTTCTDSHWSETWGRDVDEIRFISKLDTATDFYRPGK